VLTATRIDLAATDPLLAGRDTPGTEYGAHASGRAVRRCDAHAPAGDQPRAARRAGVLLTMSRRRSLRCAAGAPSDSVAATRRRRDDRADARARTSSAARLRHPRIRVELEEHARVRRAGGGAVGPLTTLRLELIVDRRRSAGWPSRSTARTSAVTLPAPCAAGTERLP